MGFNSGRPAFSEADHRDEALSLSPYATVEIALSMSWLQAQIDKWLVSCWMMLVRAVPIKSKYPPSKTITQ
jgi:hypothetical protein